MPNFSVLPDWICWIAQDADGVWWGYEVEPNLSHQSWYENEVGSCVRLGQNLSLPLDADSPDSNWVSTLKRVK